YRAGATRPDPARRPRSRQGAAGPRGEEPTQETCVKVIAGRAVACTPGVRLSSGAGAAVERGGLPRRIPTRDGRGVEVAAGAAVAAGVAATGRLSAAAACLTGLSAELYDPARTQTRVR